jgi:small subunit ribosomal protein S1
MANVLNPETESITLNTNSKHQPLTLRRSLSSRCTNPRPTPKPPKHSFHLCWTPMPQLRLQQNPKRQKLTAETHAAVAPTNKPAEHSHDSFDDFSAALEAFEREQAAEAAAVEAYGDKVVSGTVIKQTEKHLVVDVGLKSEGLVPLSRCRPHRRCASSSPAK